MKSRDLKTIHDLIVTDYAIQAIGDGKFSHTFRPKTTNTTYIFIANGTAELEEGARYNIGYYVNEKDQNIVDISCLSKNDEINPRISYLYANQLSREKHKINKEKNDARVKYTASNDYYWGKKYAWREFGLFLAKDAFYSYLAEISHPVVDCITSNPDLPYSNNDSSMAYKEEGLEDAMLQLITSAKRVTKVRFESPLYSKRFTIKGISAITDKK